MVKENERPDTEVERLQKELERCHEMIHLLTGVVDRLSQQGS
jgi:hypothetical protein